MMGHKLSLSLLFKAPIFKKKNRNSFESVPYLFPAPPMFRTGQTGGRFRRPWLWALHSLGWFT